MNRFNFFKIHLVKPFWLRFIIFIIVGLPLFSNSPARFISQILSKFFNPEFALIITYPLISFFIWLFCLPSLGLKKLLDYMAAAFAIALTTVITSSLLQYLLPFIFEKDAYASSVRLLRLYFIVLAVFPWSLTFINSFSPDSIINALMHLKKPFRETGLHFALALRVFQHVGTVVGRLLIIWKERHPSIIVMRHVGEIKNLDFIWEWIRWLACSLIDWVYACLILTFEPIPAMVNEFEILSERNKINDSSEK
ncbi:MAG: hypothetical protein PHF29_00315 [Candidatus Riflebacteria bacterium]|nr:hypothetical protein [Candidatus Riflebacteria bacterium]